MPLLRSAAAWIAACLLVAWRATCRRRCLDDPRPALRAARRPYVYALLHAHQLAAVMVNDEAQLAAMVSRSADGDLLVPALTLTGVQAVRGSSRSQRREKGGQAALRELCDRVKGGVPALLAVDGPRGPRNAVHRGVIALARQAGATILPVVAVPSRRWILQRTWDRLQIPSPFATIRLCFAPPIEPGGKDDELAVRTQLVATLQGLEAQYDPQEAAENHASNSAAA